MKFNIYTLLSVTSSIYNVFIRFIKAKIAKSEEDLSCQIKTGEYFDKETGTIYLRARYYSPVNGRFTTKDPHWDVNNMIYGDSLEDNPKVRVPNILAIKQSANLYVYCLNNTINYLDHTGLWVAVFGISGTIGVGLGANGSVALAFDSKGSVGVVMSRGRGICLPTFNISEDFILYHDINSVFSLGGDTS